MTKLTKIIREGVYDPAIFKAVFLSGGPGSGKSFVQKFTTQGLGLKLVNSDKAFEKYMKDAGLSLRMPPEENDERMKAFGKGKELTRNIRNTYLEGRLGMVLDGTGRNVAKIQSRKLDLESVGYDTYMVFVNTSLEIALERNEMRERKVPENVVKRIWQSVQDNIPIYRDMFGSDSFFVIENNDVVDYPSNNPLFVDIYKKMKNIVRVPPKNPIAKRWVANELKKKDNT